MTKPKPKVEIKKVPEKKELPKPKPVVKVPEIVPPKPDKDCPICHGKGVYPEDVQSICGCVK